MRCLCFLNFTFIYVLRLRFLFQAPNIQSLLALKGASAYRIFIEWIDLANACNVYHEDYHAKTSQWDYSQDSIGNGHRMTVSRNTKNSQQIF